MIAVMFFLPQNPLIRIEAMLGLSPCAFEKLLGIKCAFCGMTKALELLVGGEFVAAMEANFLTPIFLGVVVYVCLTWRIPQVKYMWHELLFFSLFLLATLAVNLYH